MALTSPATWKGYRPLVTTDHRLSRPGLRRVLVPAVASLTIIATVIALAGLAGGLAACRPHDPGTDPGSGGPPAIPTASKPAIKAATLRLAESYPSGGGQLAGEIEAQPGLETAVGVDDFVFCIELDPVPTAAWYAANVKVVGGKHDGLREDLFPLGMVELTFTGGKAGERIAVTLNSLTATTGDNSGVAVYSLRRAPEPRATLETWTGETWRGVAPGEAVETRPLRLRLRFTKPVRRETAEAAVRSALADVRNLNWADAQTLSFEVQDPPPVVIIDTSGIRDIEGLWTLGGVAALYTGTPPRLYAHDAASGTTTPLRLMPADISGAGLEPAGGASGSSGGAAGAGAGDHLVWARYLSRTTSEATRVELTGVYEAGSAARYAVPEGFRVVGWAGPGRLVAANETRWAVLDAKSGREIASGRLPEEYLAFLAVSPDGSKLAGYHYRFADAAPETDLTPTDLAVIPLTGTQGAQGSQVTGVTWIRDFVTTYLPGTEIILNAGPAWAPGCDAIMGISDRGNGCLVRIATLQTGAVADGPVVSGEAYSSADYISWSTDGKWWLVGNALLPVSATETTPASAPGTLSGVNNGRHLWSPDGRFVAFSDDWVALAVADLREGTVTQLGRAMACGWDGSGSLVYVLWEDAECRWDPYGP